MKTQSNYVMYIKLNHDLRVIFKNQTNAIFHSFEMDFIYYILKCHIKAAFVNLF